MNVKKTFIILLVVLILFSSITAISADDDKYYTIDHADIDLTVYINGLLHVYEKYDYSFHGSYNGIYRDITLKEGESIDNIKVTATGAYPVLKEIDKDGEKELKVFLYADAAHTKKIKDCDVRIYISYDMKNVVTVFNDVGALQYKLWGEDWDVSVGSIEAKVYLPGTSGNTYYLNPSEFNESSSLNGRVIKATTTEIPSGDFYELLVMMPESDFDANAPYAKHQNKDGKSLIEKNLQDSIKGREMWNSIYLILGLATLISPVAAIIIYLRYGREPEVDYNGIYERELPSNDPPGIINALFDNGKIGTPNMKGFEATILDLINKKAIELNVSKDSNTETKDLHLIFNEKSENNVTGSERIVIRTLKNFADGNDLNLSALNSKLSGETNARWFIEQFNNWSDSLKNNHLTENDLSHYFNSKGSTYIKILGGAGIVVGAILLILGFISTLSNGLYTLIAGIILIILSLIYLFVPDDIFGQWTKDGRLLYLKWKNFKKFLKDNSLIKEHPPESIVIWNEYLIYGTALGVADEVYKSMKMHMPTVHEDNYNNDLYWYHYYGGYGMMHSAIRTSESTVSSADSSDSFGSLGGGSGGGGGGAF